MGVVRPLTFMDIESIWASEVLPHLSGFQSMQYQDRTPPPDGSRWSFNHPIPELETIKDSTAKTKDQPQIATDGVG